MKHSLFLTLALVFLASAAEAKPGWHRFFSPTGFSVEYPLVWRDSRIDHTVHATQFKWDYDTCPGFGLRYVRYDDDHVGIPYFPGQFSISSEEIQRSTTVQTEIIFLTGLGYKIESSYDKLLNNTTNNRCGNVRIIRSDGMIGPYGQSNNSKPWLQNETDLYCPIGRRKFMFKLFYTHDDNRANEFNDVLIEMAKSFRLTPAKHVGRYCSLGRI